MKGKKLCINCHKRPANYVMIRKRHTCNGRVRFQADMRADGKHLYCRQCQQSFRDKTQTHKPRPKLRR